VISLAVSDVNIFAGTLSNGLFASTGSGSSWTQPSWTTSSVYSLAICDTNLLAISGGVQLSTNNGASWTHINTGLTDHVSLLAISDRNLFAVSNYGGVARSTDNGLTWSAINNGFFGDSTSNYSFGVNALIALDTLLFSGTNYGVFLSSNWGATWNQADNGLTDIDIRSLAICGTNLFAGTPSGVWRRPLTEMIPTLIVNRFPDNLPTHVVLEQNYPNPFNPSTVVKYQLAKNSIVTINVYDVLGREVKTLVNEWQIAGNHSFTFNASNLPSGMYFYRIQAGGNSETKKLLLLK